MDSSVLPLGLLLCLLQPGSSAQNRGNNSECVFSDSPRADVVFVLDGFNHISPADFSSVKDSLRSLVSMLGPVGPDLVRVSLVKNGRDPEAEFYLNSFADESSVVEAVSRMSQSPALPGGDTWGAVWFIRAEIMKTERGERPYVPDVYILLTDRNSSGVDTDLLSSLGDHLKSKFFVVGVKRSTELQNYKGKTEFFNVDDYSRISDVLADLTQAICRWINEKQSEPRPESLRVTGVQSRRARVSWQWNHPDQVERFQLRLFLFDSGSVMQDFIVPGHRRSIEIPHLLPNTKYTMFVRVWTDVNKISESEIGFLTTAPELVRLSRGPGRCSGSVEVKRPRSESWSSVCGSDFGLSEAAVVCAELDCGAVSELHQGALLSEDVAPSFHCDGAETSLTECESSEETRCSSAVRLTCSEVALMVYGGSCYGLSYLRNKGEWRSVMTTKEPDLDFLSLLCERSGCGSTVSGEKVHYSPMMHWWAEPECMKQSSNFSNCLDLDLSQNNQTNGGLWLLCSGFFPALRASVSSEVGAVSSVSSEKVLMLGTNFTVSCSLVDAVTVKQFDLLSPTGNYTLPPVNGSAHFLFQNSSPAHMGNYTCVYCDEFNFKGLRTEKCIKSNTLVISPGGS